MSRKRRRLTEEQKSSLLVAQSEAPDGASAIRYQAVRLYGSGYEVEDVIEICGCSQPSLLRWNRHYFEGGVAALVDGRVGGNRAYLSSEQIEELRSKLHQYEPRQLFAADEYEGEARFWTVLTLALLVERDYGVRYKRSGSYRDLFLRCQFSYQRPGQHYLSRNEEQVLDFEEALDKNSSTSPKELQKQ